MQNQNPAVQRCTRESGSSCTARSTSATPSSNRPLAIRQQARTRAAPGLWGSSIAARSPSSSACRNEKSWWSSEKARAACASASVSSSATALNAAAFAPPHPSSGVTRPQNPSLPYFINDRPPGAPRNSGLGSNYFAFKIRLGRTFKLGGHGSLHFTAEGFNVTNRTNFARVNNIVGAAFAPPFNVYGMAGLSPSQPLGFTAALPKREIQLGVRFSF